MLMFNYELAVALKTIDILKAENKETLKDNKEGKDKNKKLEQEIALLREELRLAIFKRFGKSSEKIEGQEELPFAIEYVPEEKKKKQKHKTLVILEKSQVEKSCLTTCQESIITWTYG